MTKTKIAKSSGRFGSRYGQYVRRKIADIEEKQRKKQICLFCNGRAKRLSKGIWKCKKCGRKFAAHAYYLEKDTQDIKIEKKKPVIRTKTLKEEKTNTSKEKKIKKVKSKSSEKNKKTIKTK